MSCMFSFIIALINAAKYIYRMLTQFFIIIIIILSTHPVRPWVTAGGVLISPGGFGRRPPVGVLFS